MNPQDNPEGFLAILAGIGAAIGIGKLFISAEPVTFRSFIGRAIVTAGLGACAGAITYLMPDASPILLYGAAAGMASMGASTLEYIVKTKLGVPTQEPKQP